MPGLQFDAPVRDFDAPGLHLRMNTYQSADEAAQDKAHLACCWKRSTLSRRP